ncbi:hypothetical protein EIN_227400 [Entamoeba invadens IP1]|uniref:Protein kinase domain-containing protein n=1 Tax=Entamoeba invadens IP1 TaxID=370355 RepID=A0A0A1U2P2_ENTIV|nr:hypothetical protein EIN_227400 [Entamoeba invadens IP1]ELP88327.1 hypothetical protein EIN_227400 [Entamoeba invadens IP1]|eukprot:XP_004255098.1 hypothetical protein EIN_227400 [Entamoeba invadens IP1]
MESFLTMNVGITHEIKNISTITICGVTCSISTITRSHPDLKQFTLFDIDTTTLNGTTVENALTAIKTAKSVLPVAATYKHQNGVFILCCESCLFDEVTKEKITTDQAKYFFSDIATLLTITDPLSYLLKTETVLFKLDPIHSTCRSRCDTPSSPLPHLLLSPLAFFLKSDKMTKEDLKMDSLLLISKLTNFIALLEDDSYLFVKEAKHFVGSFMNKSLEEQLNSDFLKNCKTFQELPKGTLSDYKAINFIGNGACGLVMEVEKNGVRYAMKQSCRADTLQREARAMKLFHHKNTVSFVDYIESAESFVSHFGIRTNRSKKYYYLVMELCDFTLAEYTENRVLSDTELSYLVEQINCGLEYLVKVKKVMHRDIKLDNILLKVSKDGKMQVKIADYGFCRSINGNTERGLVGTPMYSCPEILQKSSPSVKSDLYSVGVMFFKMVTGRFPKQNENIPTGNEMRGLQSLISGLVDVEEKRFGWDEYFDQRFTVHC